MVVVGRGKLTSEAGSILQIVKLTMFHIASVSRDACLELA